MRLNPGAPDYYPSPYICTYTCFFPVQPRLTPPTFPSFPPKPTAQLFPPFPANPPAPFPPFPARQVAPFPPFQAMTAHQTAEPPLHVNPRQLWVPKETHMNHNKYLSSNAAQVSFVVSESKPVDLEFGTAGSLIKGRTTIMIKNIPIKLTRAMLIQMLDQHCAEQDKQFESAFDFVYIPFDFSTGLCRGFAFVNFTDPKGAEKAYEQMHHCKWNVFKSNKIAHICYAYIQGKEALMTRFKGAQFRCYTDEFLPAIFTPPRNGTTSQPSPQVIGQRY